MINGHRPHTKSWAIIKIVKIRLFLLEKKAIEKVKIGGVVKFGTCDWMVLDRTDGKSSAHKIYGR